MKRPLRIKKKITNQEILENLLKDPNIFLYDFGRTITHYRLHTIPAFSEWELNEEKNNYFVLIKFLQDNKLIKKHMVNSFEDVENSGELRVKDFTMEGLKFAILSIEKYLKALDRHTAPEKAVKTILERDLKKIKEGRFDEETNPEGD